MIASCVCASTAWAQQPPQGGSRVAEAQRHIAAGMTLFRGHDYSGAIHEFELANAAAPSPDLWYNIARARELASDYAGAIADYRRYLRDKVDPPDRAEVEAKIRQLEILAEQRRRAALRQAEGATLRVNVEGSPPGLRLTLDEREAPSSMLMVPSPVAAGEHVVAVSADAMQPWRARVRVRPNEPAVVFVALTPATRYVTRARSHWVSGILAGLAGASLLASAGVGLAGLTDGNPRGSDLTTTSDTLLGVGCALAVGAAVAFLIERSSAATVVAR